MARFGTNRLIWTVPFPLYGIFRYLYLVHRREGGGNPSDILREQTGRISCASRSGSDGYRARVRTGPCPRMRAGGPVAIGGQKADGMSEMNVRSDAVDVEQIMRQIRARIREKRGADYTEAELQQLATVKLEKFLDPKGLRSESGRRVSGGRGWCRPAPPNYEFGEATLYETHRGLLRTLRRCFKPLLKLFFNPDKLTSALHIQSEVNTQAEKRLRALEEREPLSYELLHNLTLEITRLGIEAHNLKMRVESLSSRLDFDERRAKSLECVVQYRSNRPHHGRPPRWSRPPVERRPVRLARPPSLARGRGCRRDERPGRQLSDADADAGAGAARGARWPTGRDSHGLARVRPNRTRPEPASMTTARMTAPETTGPRLDDRRTVKLAVVVQRYAADINGGAELHARYIAERLARHAEVEVVTTCARDYVTWQNEFTPGEEIVNGLKVRRFPVDHPRSPERFGALSTTVFTRTHSVHDELRWLEAEGPASRALISHLTAVADTTDFFLFFSYRYYHAYHGVRRVPSKAILVPTAERDPAMGLSIFQPVFRAARALMYNSLEERAMIDHVSQRKGPGVVVGVGSDIPERVQPWRFKKKFGIRRPFAIYVGRIDENKGCPELFSHFQRYAVMYPQGLDLILIGSSVLPVPSHPRIRHLGYLPDADKFDGLAAADLLIMPSKFESLSMVALEAWALGKPVLANGACDVLKGQVIRSNAGLYYESFEEFAEALYLLEASGPLGGLLGRHGRDFFRRHYAWSVIERKYLEIFDRLKREPATTLEPLPGFFAKRSRALPPAAEVVASLPGGAVR